MTAGDFFVSLGGFGVDLGGMSAWTDLVGKCCSPQKWDHSRVVGRKVESSGLLSTVWMEPRIERVGALFKFVYIFNDII